jgi:hypothetical protein
MLHGNPVAVVLIRNTNLVEEQLGWLAHDHGAEELAAKPSTSARSDTGFNDGNLEVGALGSKHISRRKSARSCANDDNVRLGIRIKVLEVAAG